MKRYQLTICLALVFLPAEKCLGIAAAELGMKPDDPRAAKANSAALARYFRQHVHRDPKLTFGYGDWHLSGPVDTSDESNFKSFMITGSGGPEYAAQHQEQTKLFKNTRLVVHDLASDEFWFSLKLTDRGGPQPVSQMPVAIHFSNLTIAIPPGEVGNGLDLGDPLFSPQRGSGASALMRHVTIEGVYLTHYDLPANGKWLVQDDDGASLRRYRPIAIRCTNIYDLSVDRCAARGFWTGMHLARCDRPHVRGWRTVYCCRPLIVACHPNDTGWREDYWDTRGGVPGAFEGIYSEACIISGPVFASGTITNSRCETGYHEPYDQISLPRSLKWKIGAGSDTIDFSGIPDGKKLSDYFLPYLVVELQPSERYNPPRWIYPTRILDDQAKMYFANALSFSHHAHSVSGGSDQIRAAYGIGHTIAGAEVAISNVSNSYNQRAVHEVAKPTAAFVLGRKSISVSGWCAEGIGGEPYNPDWLPVLVAHTAGHAQQMGCQLIWNDGGRYPRSPLVVAGGHFAHGNVTPPLHVQSHNPHGFDLVAKPGSGDISLGGEGCRSRQFHWIEAEEQYAPPICCYRMQEAKRPWVIPYFVPGRSARWTARVYVDQQQAAKRNNTLNVWDGVQVGKAKLPNKSGWHYIYGETTNSPTMIQVNHAGTGVSDYFISWFAIEYL